jgi:hypothetical protein
VLQSDAFYEIYDSRICDAEGRGSRALIGRHRRTRRVEFSMGSLADDVLVDALKQAARELGYAAPR